MTPDTQVYPLELTPNRSVYLPLSELRVINQVVQNGRYRDSRAFVGLMMPDDLPNDTNLVDFFRSQSGKDHLQRKLRNLRLGLNEIAAVARFMQEACAES